MNSCLECKHYKRSERIGVKCCEFGLHESYCEKDKEDFAIEELEKIKAEIGKEFVDLQDGSEEWRSYVNESVLSCYEIVDKHISELKGNKKGVLESIAEEQKTLLDSTKAWSDYIEKHGDIY